MSLPISSSEIHWVIAQVFAWQEALAKRSWHWVEAHTYIAMFALLLASGMGLPLPEDVPLIAAGVCIARGTMTWIIAGPVAWVAMMLGDTALYILGYAFGYKVVHLPVIGRHVSQKRLKRCEEWFDRYGIWAVGIGRLFAGIRSAMVVAAGTMRFAYLKMLAADGVAAIISGGAFMVLGYWAGEHARPLRPLIEKYRLLISIIGLAAAIALMIVVWLRNRRKNAAAARTVPSGSV
jgi:membrane protein DedA with SNARE-associated domain